MLPKLTTLFFAPTGQYVEAQILELTEILAEQQIHRTWWADDSLLDRFDSIPIDRHWNWNAMGIEYDGKPLAARGLYADGVDGTRGAATIGKLGINT